MKAKFPEYRIYAGKFTDLHNLESKLSKKNLKIVNDFCQYCRTTASEGKVKKIRRILLQLYDITEKDLDKQNKDTFIHFLALLKSSDRSIPTRNETRAYLKKFIKWYYKDFKLLEELQPIMKKERFDYNPQRVNENNLITEEDITKMVKQADSSKEKALIYILYESGCRPQELLNLKWKDIFIEEEYVDLKFYSGKTKETRVFPVKSSRQYILDWKEKNHNAKPEEYIFPNRKESNTPMTTAGLNKILRNLARASGITKNIFAYLFRHSRATKLYEELPTPITEKLMGHRDMFNVYAHISSKKAREELLNKIYKSGKATPEQIKRLEELERKDKITREKVDSMEIMLKELKKQLSKKK